jgi:hypothetical protein
MMHMRSRHVSHRRDYGPCYDQPDYAYSVVITKSSCNVTASSLGGTRPKEPIGTCTVKREGDSFFFNITEQVTTEPRKSAWIENLAKATG